LSDPGDIVEGYEDNAGNAAFNAGWPKSSRRYFGGGQVHTYLGWKERCARFEVHGMVVTEKVNVADAVPAGGPSTNAPVTSVAAATAFLKDAGPQTPPLTRQGRKVADATLAAAKFTPTSDGKSAIRKFEVHGMSVTELVSAENAAGVIKDKK
jgi:hypothetical protein